MKNKQIFSPHFNDRALPIDAVIIHYTDMSSAAEAARWLCDPASNVSAHYLIDEAGGILQLVPEDKRAWHAGASYWQGCTDINSCSIGIELANPGHTHGYCAFPEGQITALLNLLKDIRTRWDIPSARILGHSDVAPRRKQDPGHLFPWDILAREGLGLWADKVSSLHHRATPRDEGTLITDLNKIGYETHSLLHALLAFQRHFQPHKVDGVADHETLSLIQDLRGLKDRTGV